MATGELLARKRPATAADLATVKLEHGRVGVRLGTKILPLEPLTRAYELDGSGLMRAIRDEQAERVTSQDLDAEQRPKCVSHREHQTPVRDQGSRGTCTAFASVACLEAMVKRTEPTTDINLSEHYANWVFQCAFAQGNHLADGLLTVVEAADVLSERGICPESLAPYRDLSRPTGQARDAAFWGLGNYRAIRKRRDAVLDSSGPYLTDARYLEHLLAHGHDVVVAVEVVGWPEDHRGVIDVLRDEDRPAKAEGWHAMLLVGYDRTSEPYHFVFKNSAGVADDQGGMMGHDGYIHLSYDYVEQYGRHGYYVTSIRQDMPTDWTCS